VWLDAHGDFNTPETSVTGFLDGMALAAAVGDCWRGSLAAVPGFRPVPPDRVLLAGTRDLDPAEEERLASSPIRQLPADRFAEGPLPTLDGHPVHLHLDLDVLHDSLGPVNTYGLTSGGVPRPRLLELVEAVSHRAGLRSVAITAYDPSVDSGDVADTALDVLEILGRDEGASPR
jgi:arginase